MTMTSALEVIKSASLPGVVRVDIRAIFGQICTEIFTTHTSRNKTPRRFVSEGQEGTSMDEWTAAVVWGIVATLIPVGVVITGIVWTIHRLLAERRGDALPERVPEDW